jgi:hypothetical protein
VASPPQMAANGGIAGRECLPDKAPERKRLNKRKISWSLVEADVAKHGR